MTHTTLPSIKGQVTIPAEIREKYHIGKETTLVIEDKGKKERRILSKILNDVRSRKLQSYDVKPLKGYKGFFRLRKGRIQIVFTKTSQSDNVIVNLALRLVYSLNLNP